MARPTTQLSWFSSCLIAGSLLASGCAPEPARTSSTSPSSLGGGDGDGSGDGDGDGSGLGDGDGTGGGDGDGDGNLASGLGCNKMDIVFVVDNSGSMREEQASLADGFPKMISVLDTFRNSSLDYRIAVTTTAFPQAVFGIMFGSGEQGTFLRTSSMERPWLQRADADLTNTFTELATVGTNGSGTEQPLKAALSAVTDRIADQTNEGFLRDDALLAFVLLTDEDDSSGTEIFPFVVDMTPVEEFPAAFDDLTGDRSRWATTVIAGDSNCNSTFGDANEAKRLKQFVELTGENATFSSICQGDLGKSLEDALNTFSVACEEFVVF